MATFPTPPSSCLHAHRLQAVDLCSMRVHKRYQSAAWPWGLACRCLRLSLACLCPILPEIDRHANIRHNKACDQLRYAERQKSVESLYRDSRRFGQGVANSGYLSQRYQKSHASTSLNFDSCSLPATTAMLAVFPLSSVFCASCAVHVWTDHELRHSQTTKASCARVPLVCARRPWTASGPVHVFARSLSRSLPPAALRCLVPELIVPPEPLASIALDSLLQLKRKGKN